jgi:hypothetical protein
MRVSESTRMYARTHLLIAQLPALGGELGVETVQKGGRVQQRVEEVLQLGARHGRVAVRVEQAEEDCECVCVHVCVRAYVCVCM